MAFGDKIRQIRLEKGLLQNHVAKTMGFENSSYVSDMERNKFVPQPDKLGKLAHALNMTETEIEDLVLEDKLEKMGLTDPTFTMMFKDVPDMTTEEKQSIIRAYQAVLRARAQKAKNK